AYGPGGECYECRRRGYNAKCGLGTLPRGPTSSPPPFSRGLPMHPEALAELRAIMRGERAQSAGTDGTSGTSTIVPAQKCPSFHAFRMFRPERGILRNDHFEPGTRSEDHTSELQSLTNLL